MKKNVVIFDFNSETSRLFSKFLYWNSIISVKYNIYDLEKDYDSTLFLIEDYNDSFNVFCLLLKKKCKITHIIVNTKYPNKAELFLQFSFAILKNNIQEHIIYLCEFIKNLINIYTNLRIFFFLHEFKKKQFLICNQMYNSCLLELMSNIYNEYGVIKRIYINCISTNGIKLNYKSRIYPYREDKFYKNVNFSLFLYNLAKSKFNNMLFIS
jgi:hypothetical protein